MRPRGVEDAAPYKQCCLNQNTPNSKNLLTFPPKSAKIKPFQMQ